MSLEPHDKQTSEPTTSRLLASRLEVAAANLNRENPTRSTEGIESRRQLVQVLELLRSEWRHTSSDLGLSDSSTYKDIARIIDIDRGTAHRLVRVSRLETIRPDSLLHFPGVAGWKRVLAGLEKTGLSETQLARLRELIGRFEGSIRSIGRSKSAVMRALQGGRRQLPRKRQDEPYDPAESELQVGEERTSEEQFHEARRVMLAGMAETTGYSVTTRFICSLIRPSPGNPNRYDLAVAEAFRGCRGQPRALPFVVGVGFAASEGSNELGSQFEVLHAATSKPAPSVVSITEGRICTMMVEPQWTTMHQLMNLAVLSVHAQATTPPEETGTHGMVLVNRHPTETLIIDLGLPATDDVDSTVSLSAYRALARQDLEGAWFDRLPDHATQHVIGTLKDWHESEPFGGFPVFAQDVCNRLDWDLSGHRFRRFIIRYPINFANYRVRYEKEK